MTESQAELIWWREQLMKLEAARDETSQQIKTARQKIKLYSQK